MVSDQTRAEVARWYDNRESDYTHVRDRLTYVRNIVMNGPIEAATDVLEKASVYAVLSIQTDVTRHERAFTAYYSTDMGIKEAARMTLYGNQKGGWLRQSLETFDFSECITILREKSYTAALAYIEDNFKGLSWTKASFTLCMCGVTELMCPDANIKNFLDIDDRIRSRADFEQACETLVYELPELNFLDPFMLQWVVFDYMRGEHSPHTPYWTEVLPSLKAEYQARLP